MKINSQKGFTLIEILLVLGVGGLLMGGVVTAIFQTTNVTRQSASQISAEEDIKYAAYWVSKDIRMAATTNLADGAPAVSDLVLDWTSWFDSNGQLNDIWHRGKYYLSGTRLMRTYGTYDPGSGTVTPPLADAQFTWDTPKTVGKYIAAINFSQQGQIITVSITSSPEGKAVTAETKTYQMYLQPKENPLQ